MLSLKSLQSSIQHKSKVTCKCHSISMNHLFHRRILHIDPERKTLNPRWHRREKKTEKFTGGWFLLCTWLCHLRIGRLPGLAVCRGAKGGRFSLIVSHFFGGAKPIKQVGRAYEKRRSIMGAYMLRLAFPVGNVSSTDYLPGFMLIGCLKQNLSFAPPLMAACLKTRQPLYLGWGGWTLQGSREGNLHTKNNYMGSRWDGRPKNGRSKVSQRTYKT